MGPVRGGRVAAVCGVLDNSSEYYMGTTGGGLWKTLDAGLSWQCVSDKFFGGSIGAVAVSKSDPNIVYAGEGEKTVWENSSSGRGLWKSIDAGSTWKFIGLPNSQHIGRIRVHPKNPDKVYVAVIGNSWQPSEDRGLYESSDGGLTWNKILFVSENTGIVDLILDPNNPQILFATSWQMRRNAYRMDDGGPGSKLWKSDDGGKTWQDLSESEGLPKGPWGISGVTISPKNSKRIWSIINAKEGGLFRSDDGGNTWQKTNSESRLTHRAFFYCRIYADSENEDLVYVLNKQILMSTDGGNNFEVLKTLHGDHHDLWLDPNNSRRMISGNDGGAQISNDAGQNWTTYYNQPTGQFYQITTDNDFPFRILGAQQDHNAIRIPHRTTNSRILQSHWEITAGGDCGHIVVDPDDPNVVYGGSSKGRLFRKDHRTGQVRSVHIWPEDMTGFGSNNLEYRFNWNFPLLFSPHNSEQLYAGSNFLHVTYDEGQSWKIMSPDLTLADPKTLKSSGGPVVQDNAGMEYYGTLLDIAESKKKQGVIWVGSDDGLIHVTKDGGKEWSNVTPPKLPKLSSVNCIEPHPKKAGTAYVAATAYEFGDYRPYLFKTHDYGQNWTRINKGIKSTHYTRVIRADLEREGLLFAGTEWGIYISFDDGLKWHKFNKNLPVVSIRDIQINEYSLIAGTHGRAIWILDDISPLRELDRIVVESDMHVYQPKPAYRLSNTVLHPVNKLTSSRNHPNGAIIHYYLKNVNPEDHITLEILEKNGRSIRKWDAQSKVPRETLRVGKGSRSKIWNLRYPGFVEFEGMALFGSTNVGPKAVPGEYVVRLSQNGVVTQTTLQVKGDPRINTAASEYQAQFDYCQEIIQHLSRTHQSITDIDSIQNTLTSLVKSQSKAQGDSNVAEITKLNDRLSQVKNVLHEPKNKVAIDAVKNGIKISNQFSYLLKETQFGDYPPTKQAVQVKNKLIKKLKDELTKLEQIKTDIGLILKD